MRALRARSHHRIGRGPASRSLPGLAVAHRALLLKLKRFTLGSMHRRSRSKPAVMLCTTAILVFAQSRPLRVPLRRYSSRLMTTARLHHSARRSMRCSRT